MDCSSDEGAGSSSKANVPNPLQSGYSSLVIDGASQNSDTEYEKAEVPNSDVGQRSVVLHWSTEQVRNWFQQNVAFEGDRMQVYLKIFQKEGVDGPALVTIKRNHRACSGMTDFEWLLFKEARKRLLDGTERREGIFEHFGTPPSTPEIENILFTSPRTSHPSRSQNALWARRNFTSAASFWNLFSIPKIPWGSDIAKDDQIELLTAEVESLRGEIASVEERETTLQARLEHLDELLKSTQLAGYLYTRIRWIALPGEPPIDDTDVDDWVQRFVVLQGSCVFFYLRSTDISPQDSILLEEIVDAGPMPTQRQDDGDQCWFSFYITSCHGLRFECSTTYKLQVDSWLTAIGGDCNAGSSLKDSAKM
eukprot:Gb_17917 [translate_table: standard]